MSPCQEGIICVHGQSWVSFPVCHHQSYLLHMISKPSQKSRTFTSEIIAQFLQFTKSTSWSPNSWLKASGFQSSDLSFLCTPETSTGCGNKKYPDQNHLGNIFSSGLKDRMESFLRTTSSHDDLLFFPSFRIYRFQHVTAPLLFLILMLGGMLQKSLLLV